MNVQEILELFPFYARGAEDLRSEMTEATVSAHLDPGAFFYREGDTCSHFALVGSGDLRVARTSKTGREITLYHVRRAETCLVNIVCAVLDRPAPAFAQAETRVHALLIPAPRLRKWMNTHETLRNHVFETVSERLLDVMALVEEVAFGRMEQRLAAYLLSGFGLANNGPRELAFTHEEIALELGSAREVISRLLKSFERRGVLRLSRGRVELMDRALLEHLASSN
jgi:CRP/FNR family transcriptional regulator